MPILIHGLIFLGKLVFTSAVVLPLFVTIGEARGADAMTCRHDSGAKNYLKNDFTQGYPRTVVFQCSYACNDQEGRKVTLMGTQEVVLRSLKHEGSKMVCQGVKVKAVGPRFQLDRIESFYAHQTEMPEIKAWARATGRNPQLETQLASELVKKLRPVIEAYTLVGQGDSPLKENFAQTAQILQDISKGLKSSDYGLLEDWLQRRNEDFPRESAEALLLSVLNSETHWRH